MPVHMAVEEIDVILDVLSFGETIIDFLPDRRAKLRDVDSFTRRVGGAPANVALALACLGRRSGLMCKVGQDEFGHFLREQLQRKGVNVDGVEFTSEAKTAITFISLNEYGDRSFTSFGGLSAEMTIRPEEVESLSVAQAAILVVGSNLMMLPNPKQATMRVLALAAQYDRFVVMDPNIRNHLWSNQSQCNDTIRKAFKHVDLLKLNDEELEQLSDGLDAATYYHDVLAPQGLTALVVTHAEGGSEVFCQDVHTEVRAPDVDVVDTTGAGDGFVSGLLAAMCEMTSASTRAKGSALREVLRGWDEAHWESALGVGCFVGSYVCQTLGATTNLPSWDDVPWRDLIGPLAELE